MDLKNVAEFYPLSPMQEGMLFHSLYEPGAGVYCEQVTYVLEGNLDMSAFRSAWLKMVERHAVLRTAFVWKDLKEPIQVVHQQMSLPLEKQDWRDLPPNEQRRRLSAYLQADRQRGFKLSSAPLMRLALFRVADEMYHFIQSYHHLILDGWSQSILRQEFFSCYEAIYQEREIHFEQRRPFKDYVKWLRNNDLSGAEVYWRETLKGFTTPTKLNVELISAGSSVDTKGYGDQQIQLSPPGTAALKTFSWQHHLTLNTVTQGTWALILARYSGEEDIVFGATSSGRPAELDGVESMVGLFINTLPVRVHVTATDSLVPYLAQFQKKLTELRQLEHTPLAQVQKWSETPRGLFDNILVFENYPTNSSGLETNGSLKIRDSHYFTRNNYPLNVMVVPEPVFTVRLMYDRKIFDDSIITRMLGHFKNLLEGFSADPERCIADFPLLTDGECHQLLGEFNATEVDYPKERCVHQLFELQAAKTPDAIALVFEGQSLSYAQLNARANQLSHHLRGLGIGPGGLVGICIERSVEMVVGVLGILKAGGTYVPLDPAFPRDRLAFMAEDAGLGLIVTKESSKEFVPDADCDSVIIDTEWGQISRQSTKNLEPMAAPEDLAYVIYTSGSTGKPKGVEISHRALTNFLWSMKSEPGFTERDVLLAVTTLSFDIAMLELYLPLIVGGRIELASHTVAADGRLLREMLDKCRATILQATPATWRMLIETGWQGTPGLAALCGGEGLPRELANQLLERTAALWNMYGPTETTIWSSVQRITPDDAEITVGRPIANTEFYILDKNLQLLPVGVPGELFIGGDGLARGYRNRTELTAKQFIPHPFSQEPGARLYRTGDLARYLEDGRVVHLGRLDNQVKLRGFRIELGEIEAILDQHHAVQKSVVVAKSGRGRCARQLSCGIYSGGTGDGTEGRRITPVFTGEAARLHGAIGICADGYTALDPEREGGSAGVTRTGPDTTESGERICGGTDTDGDETG